MNSSRARIEVALRQPEPAPAVCELAGTLRDEGLSQAELYQLFDEFRSQHERDADETLYNAVLDTMDCISGWCRADARLYDPEPPSPAA